MSSIDSTQSVSSPGSIDTSSEVFLVEDCGRGQSQCWAALGSMSCVKFNEINHRLKQSEWSLERSGSLEPMYEDADLALEAIGEDEGRQRSANYLNYLL